MVSFFFITFILLYYECKQNVFFTLNPKIRLNIIVRKSFNAKTIRTNELWMLTFMQVKTLFYYLCVCFFFVIIFCLFWRIFLFFQIVCATLKLSSIICLFKLSSLSPFHRIMSTWKSKNSYLQMKKKIKLLLFTASLVSFILFGFR